MLRNSEHEIFLSLSRRILLKLSCLTTKTQETTGTVTKAGLDVRNTYIWGTAEKIALEGIQVEQNPLLLESNHDFLKIKTNQQSKFYEGFPTGSIYSSLTPRIGNYHSTELFENNSDCILWNRTNRAGKPVMEASYFTGELEQSAELLGRLNYPAKRLTSSDLYNKEQLRFGSSNTKKVYLQDFLWHYTRPIKLWRKNERFYRDCGDTLTLSREITHDMILAYERAGDDVITTCCGNHNCINPEHLTIIPGTWVNRIYHHPKRCRHEFKALRQLEHDIMEGKISPSETEIAKERRVDKINYISKADSLFPAKIMSGEGDYCDNFEFNGFAELLDPNDYLNAQSPDGSRPLGYGLILNNRAFNYTADNHPFVKGAEKMSTLISGGNLDPTQRRSKIIVEQVQKDENLVYGLGVVQNHSVDLEPESEPLKLIY